MKNPESFTRVGTPRFRLEPVKSERLSFVAQTRCLWCGDELRLPFGVPAPVFRIGLEFVGVSCDGCVDEGTRENLTRLRERVKAASR